MADRSQGTGPDGLWAITTYWNPMRYRRRYANYQIFRRWLGVPLVAIELAYEAGFELADGDAEQIVRLRGRDVLWQKERLLNVALRTLPENCHTVVWVDCDVVFASPSWRERTIAMLARSRLVQPFAAAHRMPAGWDPDVPRPASTVVRRPAPALIASGMPPATCLGMPAEQIGCAFGFAWAARRDLLAEFSLYDACIIGGGDALLIRSAYGYLEDCVRLHLMNAAWRDHYLRWARPFHDAVRGAVGFIDGELLHLWHGRTENRRYRQRLEELSRFDFDPHADIAVDTGGAWRWSSDKAAMHTYVRDYFGARMEDE